MALPLDSSNSCYVNNMKKDTAHKITLQCPIKISYKRGVFDAYVFVTRPSVCFNRSVHCPFAHEVLCRFELVCVSD